MGKVILIFVAIAAIAITALYLSVSETEDNFRTCEVLDVADLDNIRFQDFDSITVAANTLYEASPLKELIQGEHYREAWAAPVTVPIVFLDTLRGGLKIVEEGGGMQTHSLELEDSMGIRYALRSVSKDPSGLVPDFAKELGLENILIDGISTQHPYAALVVAELSDAAQILHTQPRLVFVPKQKVLGNFNDKFGNRLYYFEYENEGEIDWTGLPEIMEILDTEDLQELKIEVGSKLSIDQNALIRARLFDLIIGDWDRHAKQWGWAIRDGQDVYQATPVPTDRDNAFFHLDGILPPMIVNDKAHPHVQSFEAEIDFMPGLVRDIDEYFLRTATPQQFTSEAIQLQTLLSDQKIEDAFKVWPRAIDSLNGAEIRQKIRTRRDDLPEYAGEFYRVLQERPMKDIILSGSEELELPDYLKKCFDCIEP